MPGDEELVTFRPGGDRQVREANLRHHAEGNGWFQRSDGKLTDQLRYGCRWSDLIAVLRRPPGRCGHWMYVPRPDRPDKALRSKVCNLVEDHLVTVPGASANSNDDYVVATCDDLHKVAAVEPHQLWKCSHVGHYANGAWHPRTDFTYGSVHPGELERRTRLSRFRA